MTDRLYYFLEEAFNLLGRRLYGAEWNGNELIAPKVPNPKTIDKKAVQLEQAIANFNDEIKAAQGEISRTTDAAKVEALTASIADLEDRRSECHLEQSSLPLLNESYTDSFELFERHRATREQLIGAFASGALQAWAMRGENGTGIPVRFWQGQRGFAYYLDLSLVVLPRSEYGKRRGIAKIRKTDFNAWLQSVTPLTEDANAALSIEQQATAWFKQEVAAKLHTPPVRDTLLEEMRGKFSQLSSRAALRVWSQNAPDTWKKAGRRHGT